MGRRNRGPYSPETCRKVSDACRFIKSLSTEARRYYLAERKARWLTNCIVEHGDRKVFALAGVDPLTGRPFAVHIEMPLDATLLDFLLLVMNCRGSADDHAVGRGEDRRAPLMHGPTEAGREASVRERLSARVATDEA